MTWQQYLTPDFRCAANFYLKGGLTTPLGDPSLPGQLPTVQTTQANNVTHDLVATELDKLVQMHATGILDADEFRAAKRRLLQL